MKKSFRFDPDKGIGKISKAVNTQEEAEQNKEIIVPKIKNVIDIYSKLETNEQKNILLRSILEKVTYLKTEKAIKRLCILSSDS